MTSSRTWVLALTSIASLMVTLDILIVSTALTSIRIGLGASIEQLEWTINAYNISFAVLLMAGAALGDRLGRRRVFALGLAVFSAASASCALAQGGGWLIAGRAVQGAGAALVAPVSVALIGATFPAERLGRAMGIYSGITGLATLAGPVVGGAITQAIGWEWIFWLNVPIGVLTIPFVFAKITETRGPNHALDLPGMLLITAAVLGAVWALVRGNGVGWSRPEVIGAIAIGLAFAVGFVRWELRAARPMVPMSFFRNRAFTVGNVVTFLLMSEVVGSAFLMAQFLQTTLGSGAFTSGLQMIPWSGTMIFVAPLAGYLADRRGVRPVILGGLLLTAIGFGWLALVAHPGVPYGQVLVPLVAIGVGNSAAIPVLGAAVLSSLGPGMVDKASGVKSMLGQIGGSFGIAILAAVFSVAGGYGSAQTFTDGFSAAIATAALLNTMAFLLATLLPGRRPSRMPRAAVEPSAVS